MSRQSGARRRRAATLVVCLALVAARPAEAMHLAEGILPLGWALAWSALAAPFVAHALARLRRAEVAERAFVAMVAAVVFLLSCMPVPVPTAGTCAHPCGTGLGALLIGPSATVLVTLVALALQALFLGHGGFTTLGADVISMGVVGAFTGWAVFTGLRRAGAPLGLAAFAAGVLSDWATYATTALELATALHGPAGIGALFGRVLVAFVPTQLPLGLLEGALTLGALRFLARRRPELLARLKVAA